MDYHAFVQSLAQLQERRESLATRLALLDRTSIPVPVYSGEKGRSLGFTLGRAGPLEERVSQPVSREVKAWAEQLPDRQKALIYPERRNLKGEGAANPAASQRAPGATATGDRTPDYRPPEERSTSPSGQEREDLETSDRKGTGGDGSGQGGSPGSGPRTGGSGGGEGSRLGLILPTLILATYVGFVISKWRELMEGGV